MAACHTAHTAHAAHSSSRHLPAFVYQWGRAGALGTQRMAGDVCVCG